MCKCMSRVSAWVCVHVHRQLKRYLLLQQCHLLTHLLPLPPQPAVLLQCVFVVVVLCLKFCFINLGLLVQDINMSVCRYQSHMWSADFSLGVSTFQSGAERPLGGAVHHLICCFKALSKSSPGNSELTSVLLSSQVKWEHFCCCAEESNPPDILEPPAALLDPALLGGSLPVLLVVYCCSGFFPAILPLSLKKLGKRRRVDCTQTSSLVTGQALWMVDRWWGMTEDCLLEHWSCP